MHNLRFAMESARDVAAEMEPLIRENWKTVESSYISSKLQPDIDLYLSLAEKDALKVFTARKNEFLVGYALVLIMRHPHRIGDLVGAVDTIFVMPEFRGGGSASALLRFVESQLKGLGVCLLSIIARDARIERWLKFADYRQVEKVFERRL